MIDAHGALLLLEALCSVVVLILLITVGKLNPFLALLLSSLGLALVAGMPMHAVVQSFETGMGGTMGHIAIVVALGTMLGKMMAESGGADRIAFTLLRIFGEKRIPWAMLCLGLIVGLPAFFEVGFVLLMPIVYTVSRRTSTPFLLIGLPMAAGLSVVHGLVPPHPAALLAVSMYHADVGRTIAYALLVGLPAAVLAGPVLAKFIAPYIEPAGDSDLSEQMSERQADKKLPPFGRTLFTILLPVLLMLGGSFAKGLGSSSGFAQTLQFVGNDDIALLIGVLFSFVSLGTASGFSRDAILRFSNECLAPTAAITLLVGAGGGFGRVLQDSGVAHSVVTLAMQIHIPLLLLSWVLAALMRLATGSATVAMTTAADIVAPIALHTPHVSPELLAIATGGGSLIFSHVNDGGFWLVKQYFNLTVAQTFKSWSICETIISVTSLAFVLLLSIR